MPVETLKIPAPRPEALASDLKLSFEDLPSRLDDKGLTLRVPPERLLEVMVTLRNKPGFAFTQLVDLCGVDYLAYGSGYEGLFTKDAMSRDEVAKKHDSSFPSKRFAVVYHLLSMKHNNRLRVRVLTKDDEFPTCPSVTSIWPVANWYEREAFDLFGIIFDKHPDLRRLLTDYGFIGNPFRKDFPVYGKMEMRYDPSKGRVIYQPVTIRPREVVPRVCRSDNFGAAQDG